MQSAEWAAPDTLDWYVGGDLVQTDVLDLQEMAAGGGVRLEQTLSLELTADADTWVVAVVHGEKSLFPYVPFNQTRDEDLTMAALDADEVANPATPFAFTNPIFVDFDGDGEIAPSHHVVPQDVEDYRAENRLLPY